MGRNKTLINSELIELVESDLSEIKDSDTVIKLRAIKAAYSHNVSEVASIFDIGRSSLERWMSNYKRLGIEGLKNKSRGHNPSKLSQEEKEIIKGWILTCKDSTGNQVHWTLKRLIKEILMVFNKEITKTPLWLTLTSLNLSVKKPRPKHYKSDEAKQSEFKKTQEMINCLKETGNNKVMFFDEGRFGLRSTTMRIWAETGKRTTIKVMQGFKNFYAYSAVCPFDGENFSLILPGVNTDYMCLYLEQLSISYPETKIFLIMDQAGWHKSKEIKVFENIKIIYLPAYSPELNPVEKLWEWIKKECSHNFIYSDLEDLDKAVCNEYQKLSNNDFKRLCNCNYLSLYN